MISTVPAIVRNNAEASRGRGKSISDNFLPDAPDLMHVGYDHLVFHIPEVTMPVSDGLLSLFAGY